MLNIKELSDPGSQLEFLINELNLIESQNGTAIILGHLPPNQGCNNAWGQRFKAALERYQHLIRFSLFGHSHADSFSVSKSFASPQMNIGTVFTGPSLTSWKGGSPSISVIELDEETLLPVNRLTYSLDLE